MNKVIFGKKLGMSASYLGDSRVGVTKVALLPMTVSQLKSASVDGYPSAQVAFGTPGRSPKKALLGHLKKSGATAAFTREIPFAEDLEVGKLISPADVIQVGSVCLVQGTSKGKGFAGVVKRWNFAGGPRTHGQSDRLRAPGSIGQGTTPGRVYKGKHMAGRMGGDTVTVKGALVVSFDPQTNIAELSGPIPGSISSLVRLTVVSTKTIPGAQES